MNRKTCPFQLCYRVLAYGMDITTGATHQFFFNYPESDSPTSRQLTTEADLPKQAKFNEITKLPNGEGEAMQ